MGKIELTPSKEELPVIMKQDKEEDINETVGIWKPSKEVKEENGNKRVENMNEEILFESSQETEEIEEDKTISPWKDLANIKKEKSEKEQNIEKTNKKKLIIPIGIAVIIVLVIGVLSIFGKQSDNKIE